MAKVTVYIPDDLLARARSRDPSAANTSQLVQHALERLAGTDEPAYAQRPDDVAEQLDVARTVLARAARAEYGQGYEGGLDAASQLDWSLLDELHRSYQFDLARWAYVWRSSAAHDAAEGDFQPPRWFAVLLPFLGDLIDPIGYDNTPRRTDAYVRGFGHALRDAWRAVEHGTTTREQPDDDQED